MNTKLNNLSKVHEACGAAQANEMLAKGYHLIATHAAFSNSGDARIYYIFGEEKKRPVDADDDETRSDEVPIPKGRLR